jgi:RimJ/RimL family protein N-acetyltransferase
MFPELTRDDVFMIGTDRLWLRWPRLDDAAEIARSAGDPRVASMTASWPVGATSDFARERIVKMRDANTAGTGFSFVLTRRGAWHEPIGLAGFSLVEGTQGAVASGGYHLAPEHWGNGYATEALDSIIGMLRLLTRIPRLTASVMPENTASAGVLLKNGFHKTGVGMLTTEYRGPFALNHYARDLRNAPALANISSHPKSSLSFSIPCPEPIAS